MNDTLYWIDDWQEWLEVLADSDMCFVEFLDFEDDDEDDDDDVFDFR